MRAPLGLGRIEASTSSMTISTDPSIFSPISFTPSPRKPQAFQFPPVMDADPGGSNSDPSLGPDSDDDPQDESDPEMR